MARIGFIMSMILTLLGVVLLSISLLVHALVPKVGHIAFQIGGGFPSYEPSPVLWLHHALAVGCIIVGASLSNWFWKTDRARPSGP